MDVYIPPDQMVPQGDADEFYDEHIEATLPPIDPYQDIGMYDGQTDTRSPSTDE